jgi:hypothetical protein
MAAERPTLKLDYATPQPPPIERRPLFRVVAGILCVLGLAGFGMTVCVILRGGSWLLAPGLLAVAYYVYVTGSIAFRGGFGVAVTRRP